MTTMIKFEYKTLERRQKNQKHHYCTIVSVAAAIIGFEL